MAKDQRKAAVQAGYNFRRLEVYTPEEIDHCEKSKNIKRYITAKESQSSNTATAYKTKLQAFAQFVYRKLDKVAIDSLIEEIKAGKRDPYETIQDFVYFLQKERPGDKLSNNVIRESAKTVRKFFKSCKIKVSIEDFNEFVSLPRHEKPKKTGITKNDIIELIASPAAGPRLKTFLMFLGATGPRPIEPCALTERDIEFMDLKAADTSKNASWVNFNPKYDKMRDARRRPLTVEVDRQLRIWLDYKYRERRTTKIGKNGKLVHVTVKPERDPDSLLFAHVHFDGERPTPENLYDTIADEFANLVDLLGRGQRVGAGKGKRRKLTLGRFRSWVKTTYSNLGNRDFGEFMIGHSGSTYYETAGDEAIVKTLRQYERYFTFLDAKALEAIGADQQSKIEELREQLEKNNEKWERFVANFMRLYAEERMMAKFGTPEGQKMMDEERKAFFEYAKQFLAEREGRKEAVATVTTTTTSSTGQEDSISGGQ
ncbi:hypothetical protein Ngar_c13650 [Candidatus Nitrososphaera gargensis Ga9.2]|uniref:Integrase family protein n=1 Tax=Nitrososphaera gargensis (strain Ga9.2) TaxID=1237085 RepID=K0IHC5_NITGG|nr:hypothetical protein [Candidatus Nitrososphaera gargensis]AFU58303.1 hypothetical protein Ngar_c13650 [Candidatus Nitrososphaera gargensis Ga9.2]